MSLEFSPAIEKKGSRVNVQAKIYVINLPKDVERLEWFRTEMATKWPGMPYEVVPAVVGKDIPDEAYDRQVDVRRTKALFGREMARGEAGLVLTHHLIFKKMIDDKVEVAIIFEDDARLGTKLQEYCPDLTTWLGNQSGGTALILSEAHKARHWRGFLIGKKGLRICKPISIYGTYGFMLNQKAARTLLSFTTPVFCFADDWARFRDEAGIALYSVVPFLVGNNDFDRRKSSLSDEREAVWRQASVIRQKANFFLRLARVLRAGLLKCVERLTGVTVVVQRSNHGLD